MMSSSTDHPPLFKDSGNSDHGGDCGVAVDDAPKTADAAASLDGEFDERQRGGGTHLIARVLQQGSPRNRKGKGKGKSKKIVVTATPAPAPPAPATAAAASSGGGSSSSSSTAAGLEYGHRRKSLVPEWGMAMDFSTIFRPRKRLSVKDSLAVVGLKKALLIGERGRRSDDWC